MVKQEALIRNWQIDGEVLIGEVYGHPRIIDGHRVRTSTIVKFNKKAGIVETLHTYYKLEGYNESEESTEGC